MKKIKYLVMAFAAICFTAGLTSCEKEKEVEKIVEVPVEVVKTDTIKVPVEVPQDNNWSRYQKEVTNHVKDNKKNDKVILLVAFGSTTKFPEIPVSLERNTEVFRHPLL